MISQAIILAAGKGTRMRELTKDKPKCLATLFGIPIIEWTLSSLDYLGVREVVIVIGWMGHKIKRALAHWKHKMRIKFAFNRYYSKYENAVSILAASRYLRREFLVLMSDHFYSLRVLRKIVDWSSLTIGVDTQPNPAIDIEEATKVLVTGGLVKAIGKNISHYNAVDIGAFILDRRILRYIKRVIYKRKRGALSEVIMSMIQDGYEFKACDVKGGFWIDIDTPNDLKKAQEHISLLSDKYNIVLQKAQLLSQFI